MVNWDLDRHRATLRGEPLKMSRDVKAVLVLGGGGHAKVVIALLKKLHMTVAGYTDRVDRGSILGVDYLGPDQVIAQVIEQRVASDAVIGVGKLDGSPVRRAIAERMRTYDVRLPVVQSPNAVVNETVIVGQGTVVCDGVVVNVGTNVGSLCILNSNSTVEHDCTLGRNVHVAPGATICGAVHIGDDCMIGAGVTVANGVRVADACLIGAGSTVTRDITQTGVYAGSPARRIR